MTSPITVLGAALALVFSTQVFAQGSAAFTATGASCGEVTWSEEALEQYPSIASACQEVMERDGEYYVRFEGEVRRVSNRGGRVTIAFEEGDTLTLTPPENLNLTIDGRQRAPRDLRPGDELSFYVPENQLTATFFAGQPEKGFACAGWRIDHRENAALGPAVVGMDVLQHKGTIMGQRAGQ